MADAITAATTATTSTSKAKDAQVKLGADLQSFLRLLTTQLKNQDPTSPMESAEFTSQIAQLASVEQGIATNEHLEKLVGMNQQTSGVVGYIGKEIVAEGNKVSLTDGKATLRFEVLGASKEVNVSVMNSAGTVIYTAKGENKTGVQELAWNGLDRNGNKVADGQYKIEVTAKDTKNKQVKSKVYTTGVVNGIGFSGTETNLSLGTGGTIPLSKVISVREPEKPVVAPVAAPVD
jgi:flagellar basal-body rod modification protein FlgD